jgi:hypothetical protein
MTFDLTWHDPNKTLLTTYDGTVTAEELTRSIEGIIGALDESTANRVHVIVDWRQATDYPYFVDLLPPARKLLKHSRLGWIVIVGPNNTVKLWADLFSGITEFRYKIFDTLDNAKEFLRTAVLS